MITTDLVNVYIRATDPLSAIGVKAELHEYSAFRMVTVPEGDGSPQVAVVVVDEVDGTAVDAIRSLRHGDRCPVVLVVARLDDVGLLAAVEAGACGILRRHEATSERLVDAVIIASKGDGSIPSDLLGRLLEQIGSFQRSVLAPRGQSLTGFSDRELDVLRLLAEGWDTAEISGKLAYSERTIKSVIHDLVTRHQLRNRSHAVAHAVRQGLI
jgi:DNA-binding NarL/FixJ family response regulator